MIWILEDVCIIITSSTSSYQVFWFWSVSKLTINTKTKVLPVVCSRCRKIIFVIGSVYSVPLNNHFYNFSGETEFVAERKYMLLFIFCCAVCCITLYLFLPRHFLSWQDVMVVGVLMAKLYYQIFHENHYESRIWFIVILMKYLIVQLRHQIFHENHYESRIWFISIILFDSDITLSLVTYHIWEFFFFSIWELICSFQACPLSLLLERQ